MRTHSKDTILGDPIHISKLLRRSMSHWDAISERLARRTVKLAPERTREILDELVRQSCYETGEIPGGTVLEKHSQG